jgi:hypothetical protein
MFPQGLLPASSKSGFTQRRSVVPELAGPQAVTADLSANQATNVNKTGSFKTAKPRTIRFRQAVFHPINQRRQVTNEHA